MLFHVLGIGPVGTLIAHHLRHVLDERHSVVLIHKHLAQMRRTRKMGSEVIVERDGIRTLSSGFRSEVSDTQKQQREDQLNAQRVRKAEIRARYSDDLTDGDNSSKETHLIHPPSGTIESLIVTTKAQSVTPAIQQLLPRIGPNSTIVLLNNGMGVYENLLQYIFRNPEQRPHFILATNDHGAFLKGYMHCVHAGIGAIKFGIVPDPWGRDFEASASSGGQLSLKDIMEHDDDERYFSLRNTVAVLSSLSALNASWVPFSSVMTAIKRKLVVNSVINPLTAIMGCRNGDVFTSDAANRICRRVCMEAEWVFSAEYAAQEGLTKNLFISSRGDRRLPVVPSALKGESLEEEVKRVASITTGNVSSMLADIQKGKHTEIDFMNGHLLRMGLDYKVHMPTTATLLNLIKMREAIPLDPSLLAGKQNTCKDVLGYAAGTFSLIKIPLADFSADLYDEQLELDEELST
ncbi:hypothetical protein EWM64_g1931 [Hericium alpestre]|uniref:2-dehydropantoate 2-reductase n=1 Tax=Hericium alpestre TaxID=135208 RepID=A0A4Z0A4Y6_9AGAM|nr:hypothetical protein EWM64_g1931 [Hericium alpestre]